MANDKYYLYHLRDPEKSGGFGHDGYTGITNNPARRFSEHMKACRVGAHPNRKVQTLYDDANGMLQMHIVKEATKDEVFASEGLVVNRANKHANIQRGGGPLRGLHENALIRHAGLGARNIGLPTWRPESSSVSSQQIALIAAAGIAIAAGFFHGYQRYKRGNRLNLPSLQTSASTGTTSQLLNDDAARQASLEARKARLKELDKKDSAYIRNFLGTAAWCTALALAAEILKRE